MHLAGHAEGILSRVCPRSAGRASEFRARTVQMTQRVGEHCSLNSVLTHRFSCRGWTNQNWCTTRVVVRLKKCFSIPLQSGAVKTIDNNSLFLICHLYDESMLPNWIVLSADRPFSVRRFRSARQAPVESSLLFTVRTSLTRLLTAFCNSVCFLCGH